ncbi:MAG: hypothetical protein WA446_12770 [Steroidobacteraceae bacterium]
MGLCLEHLPGFCAQHFELLEHAPQVDVHGSPQSGKRTQLEQNDQTEDKHGSSQCRLRDIM